MIKLILYWLLLTTLAMCAVDAIGFFIHAPWLLVGIVKFIVGFASGWKLADRLKELRTK